MQDLHDILLSLYNLKLPTVDHKHIAFVMAFLHNVGPLCARDFSHTSYQSVYIVVIELLEEKQRLKPKEYATIDC